MVYRLPIRCCPNPLLLSVIRPPKVECTQGHNLAHSDSRMKKPVRPLRAALTLVLAAALLSVVLVVWRQANPGTWTFPARVATLVSQTVAKRPTSSQDTAVPGRAPTPMPALSPTATAAPTATPPPTLTPTAMPTPTIAPAPTFPPTPAPLHRAAQPAVTLAGLRHEWQTWNNCGPATLAMLMSFFGSQLDQATAGVALRLSADDKNVSPQELVAFARSQGYAADLYVNGSGELARTLLSNDIPVLIESWYEDEIKGGIGHYRLLTGYDDAQQQWIAYDSLDYSNLIPGDVYAGIRMPYDRGDALWKVFNRTYVLVYPPDRARWFRASWAPTRRRT